jgi:hypothetical protein
MSSKHPRLGGNSDFGSEGNREAGAHRIYFLGFPPDCSRPRCTVSKHSISVTFYHGSMSISPGLSKVLFGPTVHLSCGYYTYSYASQEKPYATPYVLIDVAFRVETDSSEPESLLFLTLVSPISSSNTSTPCR